MLSFTTDLLALPFKFNYFLLVHASIDSICLPSMMHHSARAVRLLTKGAIFMHLLNFMLCL
jgi:hypothetical protein